MALLSVIVRVDHGKIIDFISQANLGRMLVLLMDVLRLQS